MRSTVNQQRLARLFEQLRNVDDVARSLPEDDERRTRLLNATEDVLHAEQPIRARVAAPLTGFTAKTIRAWARHGLIAIRRRRPHMLVSVASVYAVAHLIHELRRTNATRDVIDQVVNRLEDGLFLSSPNMQEGLAQMQRGEGYLLRPKPSDADDQPDEWEPVNLHTAWTELHDRRMAEPGAAEAYEATRMAYELGKAVREQREAQGWSQTRLAQAAGTTPSAVAHFEAGGTVPTLPVLERLAQALGVELDVSFRPKSDN